MNFKRYQHLERYGTTATEGIDIGELYIFPKIDGTNASVWLNSEGVVCAGSRNRELGSGKNDNAGFRAWIKEQDNIREYLEANPTHRLYGEWLVPHTLKTYKEDAWRRFYIFDVAVDVESTIQNEKGIEYLKYDSYKEELEKYGLDYIAPIIILKNATYERIYLQLERNNFLIKDGEGYGEGVVLKNYDWVNRFGRQIWAKIVSSDFKDKHTKTMGAPVVSYADLAEEKIVSKFLTKAMCDKVVAKIENEKGEFSSRDISHLLETIYYDLITEESWNFIKELKNPTINYKTLRTLVTNKTKEHLPNIF